MERMHRPTSATQRRFPRSGRDCRGIRLRSVVRHGEHGNPLLVLAWFRSRRYCFVNRISAHGPDGVTLISPPSWVTPTGISGDRRQVTGRPAAKASLIRLAAPSILVVHSGTIRAALAIALELSPDAALRFV